MNCSNCESKIDLTKIKSNIDRKGTLMFCDPSIKKKENLTFDFEPKTKRQTVAMYSNGVNIETDGSNFFVVDYYRKNKIKIYPTKELAEKFIEKMPNQSLNWIKRMLHLFTKKL